MFCRKCGKVNPDKARFCLDCGEPLDKNYVPVNVSVPIQKPKSKVGCLSIVGSIAINVIVFAVIGNLTKDNTNSISDNIASGLSSTAISSTIKIPEATEPPKETAEPPKKDNLEVLNVDSKSTEYGDRSVVGTIKNNTSRTYDYVSVEINLYDSAGNLVGSTLDNVNNLEPEGKWNFEALILEENATKYKIVKISGY
jgi:hypothetical protein